MATISNSMSHEIEQRRRWNRSIQRGLRQCSLYAHQFINGQMLRNHKYIDETEAFMRAEAKRDPNLMRMEVM